MGIENIQSRSQARFTFATVRFRLLCAVVVVCAWIASAFGAEKSAPLSAQQIAGQFAAGVVGEHPTDGSAGAAITVGLALVIERKLGRRFGVGRRARAAARGAGGGGLRRDGGAQRRGARGVALRSRRRDGRGLGF